MELSIYQIDAFSSTLFGGNPAAVVPLTEWLPDDLMQKIAAENNLAETAFYIPNGEEYSLRWFTPTVEVKLCGHATLAAAFVLFHFEKSEKDEKDEILFHTKSGVLKVNKKGNDIIMDFPADTITQIKNVPEGLVAGLKCEIIEVYKGETDYIVVVDNQRVVEGLQPDFRALSSYEARGTIVTARGEDCDFVSRCFYPQTGVDEDPVTGSAHTSLTVYWNMKIGKTSFQAKQLSKRGGEISCKIRQNRVFLEGKGKCYMIGKINV